MTTPRSTRAATGNGRPARRRSTVRRRLPIALVVATVVGVWLGVDAPDVSPVAPPAPVPAAEQPVGAP